MLDKKRLMALSDEVRVPILIGLSTLYHVGIIQQQLAESQSALSMGNPNEEPDKLAERILHHRRATAGLTELLDAGEFAAKELSK